MAIKIEIKLILKIPLENKSDKCCFSVIKVNLKKVIELRIISDYSKR